MNSSSIRSSLSPDAQRRISAWHNSLHDALNYLHTGDYIYQLPERYHIYQAFEGYPSKVHVSEIARQGLTESALIAFFQVFKSGREGEGIASNRDLARVRGKMKAYVLKQLAWTEEQYDTIYHTLEQKRDQLTAHYDGEAAGFQTINPSLIVMAMRGALLSRSERKDFMLLTTKVFEFVHKVTMNEI